MNVSAHDRHQAVGGRTKYHEYETGSEGKVNPTSYSPTVRILRQYTPETAILSEDRREGAEGAAFPLCSINTGSTLSPS